MAYIENFTSKLDWAMPFQRTSKAPLDRTAIFSSYADALAYARQDGSDSRKLGGTSYVGQLIAVYGPLTEGGNDEVAAYIITSVGAQSAALMKLAQTTASGDVAEDINQLWAAINGILTRLAALEEFKQNEELKPDVNTTYEFNTGVTTDGSIQVVPSDGDAYEVQIKGWQSLVDLATGRTSAYVYKNANDAAFVTDCKNNKKFKVGDIIYFTDNNIADQWVTSKLDVADAEGIWYTFSDFETEKPDLTVYYTKEETEAKFATIVSLNNYAKKSELRNVSDALNQHIDQANQKIGDVKVNATSGDYYTLQSQIGNTKVKSDGSILSLQEQIDNIDVSAQINSAINTLTTDKVGGTARSYIKEIRQSDGKIEAVAASLPEVVVEQVQATDAGEQGTGEIAVVTKIEADTDEHELVATNSYAVRQSYVDTLVETSITDLRNELAGTEGSSGNTISNIASRVKILEDKNLDSRLTTVESQMTTAQADIAKLKTDVVSANNIAVDAQSRVSGLETTVSQNTSNIATLSKALTDTTEVLSSAISSRVKEIQINGVKQTMTEGVVNITQISTDVLTQGNNMLVLDCLNAALTDNQ